nr:PREDICTED: chymotrypsin inhibitor-like [Megachile rotundata]
MNRYQLETVTLVDAQCGENQVWDNCGSSCPTTCEDSGPKTCIMIQILYTKSDEGCMITREHTLSTLMHPVKVVPSFWQCVAGCTCKEGFVKNSVGACVSPSQC